MKNLLVGNGVTIQFGGLEYSNKNIIKRARNNLYTKNFPEELYHFKTIQYLEELFRNIPAILSGEYDSYISGIRKESLEHFKNRYTGWEDIELFDIGLEDYFLIHFLVSNKYNVTNPDRYIITQSVKMMFLDSIYNGGEIQEIYKKYPKKFVDFLNTFKNIYTTNYDRNLEFVSNSNIYYLHGAFHILAEVYDSKSFRNRLADNQFILNNLSNPEGYEYLHSTALMAYCGEDKEFIVEYPDNANQAIDKLVNAYKTNQGMKNMIDNLKNDRNPLMKNLYSTIMLKLQEEKVSFQTNDSFYMFEEIKEELQILGLSPENDNHIFSRINDNTKLSKIIYYYFNDSDQNAAKKVFNNKILVLEPVQDFWKSILE